MICSWCEDHDKGEEKKPHWCKRLELIQPECVCRGRHYT